MQWHVVAAVFAVALLAQVPVCRSGIVLDDGRVVSAGAALFSKSLGASLMPTGTLQATNLSAVFVANDIFESGDALSLGTHSTQSGSLKLSTVSA